MPVLQTSMLSVSHLLSQAPAEGFDCGDCTACCTVLAVTELQKPMRFACEHICRDGCRIYVERPAGCRQFNCLWLRGALISQANVPNLTETVSELSDLTLRPDHLGVIWDYFVDATTGVPCLVAFEVWTDAFRRPDVMEQLIKVCQASRLRLSFRNGDWVEVSGCEEIAAVFE